MFAFHREATLRLSDDDLRNQRLPMAGFNEDRIWTQVPALA